MEVDCKIPFKKVDVLKSCFSLITLFLSKYRALLLDMFSKSWMVTRKEFHSRVAQENMPVPSRKDWMIIQQVC